MLGSLDVFFPSFWVGGSWFPGLSGRGKLRVSGGHPLAGLWGILFLDTALWYFTTKDSRSAHQSWRSL